MNHLALGWPGYGELIIVLVVVLVFFGGKKLPELARAMGRSITEFREGLKGDAQLREGDKDPTELDKGKDKGGS